MAERAAMPRTHSGMRVILPSGSLTVSIASMASMVAEGWWKKRGGMTGREREKEREDRIRKRRWHPEKEGGEGKRSEG